MKLLDSLRFRISTIFSRSQMNAQIDDEIHSHIQHRADDIERTGLHRAEAERRANLEFGRRERFKEECRETFSGNSIEILTQDMRFAVRMLCKSPAFTAIAVLTLALGIGANTAIFSIVNCVILRPLSFRDPGRLVRLYMYNKQFDNLGATFPDLLDWRARNRSFEGLAATWENDSNLFDQNGPTKIRSAVASANLFAVLGVPPLLGRAFLPAEDRLGYEHAVMISYGLWQTRYGGDSTVLGKAITVDGTSYAVIGVLPRGFQYPGKTDVWLPMGLGEEALIRFHDNRRIHAMETVGRLLPGTTFDRTSLDMNVLAEQLAREYPASNTGWKVRLVSLGEDTVGTSRKGLLILMGAAGFVLLIACANLASLLLVRGSVRAKEFAIRASLGGSRTRLLRQIVTESALLGLLGGATGAMLAFASQAAIVAMIPKDLPRIDEIRLDAHALLFAFALALATSAVFGIGPALQNKRVNLQSALKTGGWQAVGNSNPALRKVLVITEVACALILVIGATLLAESLFRLMRVQPGFNSLDVITGTIGYPDSYATQEQKTVFAKRVISNLTEMPGVLDAAGTSLLPLYNFKRQFSPIQIVGHPSDPHHEPESEITTVTPEFFRSMQIPLIAGRTFTEVDGGLDSGPIVVNEAAARRFWPNQNPLGRQVRFEWIGTVVREVIGVVGDTKQTSLATQSEPEIYLPFYGIASPYLTFVVRTNANPAAFANVLDDQVHKVDGTIPVYDVQTLERLTAESFAPNRFYLRLISAFGMMALGLAAIGVYGLISFNVVQRTHELGVRLALGALPGGLLRQIAWEGMRLTLVGLVVGVACALVLTRFISGLLYGIAPADPMTLIGASGLLLLSEMAACYIPARRAMRVDPMVALRYE